MTQHADGRIRTSSRDWTPLGLVVAGAITLGLVGIGRFFEADWNRVDLLLGSFPAGGSLVYVVVGLAGLHGRTSRTDRTRPVPRSRPPERERGRWRE